MGREKLADSLVLISAKQALCLLSNAAQVKGVLAEKVHAGQFDFTFT